MKFYSILLFITFFILLIALFYFNIKKFCVYSREPRKADAIVVLGGWNSKQRVEYGVKLYKEGYAPVVILSDGYTVCEDVSCDLMKQYAIKLGVKKSDIITECTSTDTNESALMVKEIIQENKFKSIILITADYHSRRAYSLFKKVLVDVDILSCPAITYSDNKWSNWWFNKSLRDNVLRELFKKIYSLLTFKGS